MTNAEKLVHDVDGDSDGEKLRASFMSGHLAHCGWHHEYCPERFQTFQFTSAEHQKKQHVLRIRNVLRHFAASGRCLMFMRVFFFCLGEI
jgi:hypothetical protein